MSDGAEAGIRIAWAILRVFLLFVSLFILPIKLLIHHQVQSNRQKALEKKAQALKLSFRSRQDDGLATKYHFLNQVDKVSGGEEHYCLNVLDGKHQDQPVMAFDFHYISDTKVWWWAPSWRRHCYLSFFVIDLDRHFPELTLAREGIFSKIGQAVGFRDIDFESHEFSKRYVVRSKDKKFAYDFCNAKMIDYLLDQPTLPIEVDDNALAIGFDSQYNVHEAGPNIKRLVTIRSLMPNYLFEKKQAEA